MKYLLYPAADDQARDFYERQSSKMKEQLIASSSLSQSVKHIQLYQHYHQLPNVFDKNFYEQASALLARENINIIFCSNEFVAHELRQLFDDCDIIVIGDGQYSLTKRYMSFELQAADFFSLFTQKHKRNPIITLSEQFRNVPFWAI